MARSIGAARAATSRQHGMVDGLPPASATENNGTVGEIFRDGAASTLFWVDQ
jgi:hypothetical protein